MKEVIAIIGAAGKLGSALTCRLAATGRRLLVHDPLAGLLNDLLGTLYNEQPQADVEAIATARDAAWEADIIIPTVPYDAQLAIACEIREVVTRKIVVSVVNPISSRLTVPTTSAAEELARVLSNARVVKGFNTVSAADIMYPDANGIPFDCFVAGDDAEAISRVSKLVRDIGLHPIVAGNLTTSRILEGMTMLLMSLARRYGWTEHVGWKILNTGSVAFNQRAEW